MNKKKKAAMLAGGKIAAQVLAGVLENVAPGISTKKLDRIAEEKIRSAGAAPSFKGFKDYPFATCININEGVVHGQPSADEIVKKGDLVTVDLGVRHRNFHTDTAHTVQVQNSFDEFLKTGQHALEKAIDQCRAGNHIGDISFAIQETIEEAGFYVIKELVGHGIGKKLHESPSIPGYGNPGEGEKLKEGLALAVEVIYSLEETGLVQLEDGWTLVTETGCPAAMFEHTVLVTTGKPIVITRLG